MTQRRSRPSLATETAPKSSTTSTSQMVPQPTDSDQTTRYVIHDDECELGKSGQPVVETNPYACYCAMREVGWVAVEANALMDLHIADSDEYAARRAVYDRRKFALLAYIEASE